MPRHPFGPSQGPPFKPKAPRPKKAPLAITFAAASASSEASLGATGTIAASIAMSGEATLAPAGELLVPAAALSGTATFAATTEDDVEQFAASGESTFSETSAVVVAALAAGGASTVTGGTPTLT